MSTFFIIIFEIIVRVLIVGACAVGAYYFFRVTKSPHVIIGSIIGVVAVAVAFNIFIPSSYTPGNRITFTHHLTSQQAAESRAKSSDRADAASMEAEASSKRAESKSLERAKASSKQAAAHAKSISTSKKNESTAESLSGNKVKVGGISYEKVSMTTLTDTPEDYDGSNIQTRGTITLIQRDKDNSNMYFVVMVPKDSNTSSGYADGHGIVAQIDIDTLKDNSLTEGDDLTINGGALQDEVTVNGKTVAMSVIVDSVTVHN
ncbi:hypothetical protein LZY01_23870 [Levilactobacillus zymae]|uniref:Uncharacterized protein n=1 Tax=Levilactobacillus zymae TaxID=267363 RepID=A0ABQ0WZF1_9LACO|nr:hypothetical protein [Levilactobacillus zymae]QFR61053.1 hypothetical protein LZ395_05710 [Levilactobacillus zymae]GEO73219.1 hypothetical protein LZY01_23870 [Levilactobacillus zymae]